jgi:hypothetical protein
MPALRKKTEKRVDKARLQKQLRLVTQKAKRLDAEAKRLDAEAKRLDAHIKDLTKILIQGHFRVL